MYRAENDPSAPRWHAKARHKRYSSKRLSIAGSLFDAALARFLPWRAYDYPGIGQGAKEMFRDRLTTGQIVGMRHGTQKMPVDVALFFAAQLIERAAQDTELARQLQEYAANFKDGRVELMARGRATMAARKRGLSL